MNLSLKKLMNTLNMPVRPSFCKKRDRNTFVIEMSEESLNIQTNRRHQFLALQTLLSSPHVTVTDQTREWVVNSGNPLLYDQSFHYSALLRL